MTRATLIFSISLAFIMPLNAAACPAETNEECASLFAKNMTEIVSRTSTGRGPFILSKVTSTGSSVTLTYQGQFTQDDFSWLLSEKGESAEDFLAFTGHDFISYQCDGPLKNLKSRGLTVHNVLTFKDGTQLGGFDLPDCPEG